MAAAAAKLQQFARVEAAGSTEKAEEDARADTDTEGEEESPAEEQEVQQGSRDAVTSLVSSCKQSLTQQLQEVKGVTAQINAALQKIDKRVGAVEERVSTAEDHIVQLQKAERKFTQAISELAAKNEDLENRSRRNNIRIVGVPEKAEGRNPTEYVESWLLETFGDAALTKVFAVERAHRVPPKPPVPGASPRTMLAKILNYRDIILRKGQRHDGSDTIEGQRIAIYPDYSALVQKQRMMFTAVEPLAAKIRQSDEVPGFRYGSVEEKIALYADDILLFLADLDDALKGAIEIIEKFGALCCQRHDCCYGALSRTGCFPMYQPYIFSRVARNITCDDQDLHGCARRSCECDRAAAICFQTFDHRYSRSHSKNMPRKGCEGPQPPCEPCAV
ncbi:unnamed protein product [Ranitomeya imitator]|uniref:Phospholipase A2-like central domain-containing protein n=1 Tax=Ranitomeya imitator TaxID=111125 RepID=A0ABN9MBN5_9NEOB|nr:unnamed protein product [Ranitomeya imitator]